MSIYRTFVILNFSWPSGVSVKYTRLSIIKMDAYNMSHYFNITQSDLVNNYDDYITNNNKSFNNETFYNRTRPVAFHNGTQPGSNLSTDVKNDFIDKFVIYSNLFVSFFGGWGHILSLIILICPPFNEMPHSLFLAALALVDLAYMIRQFNISLIRIITGRPAILVNSFLCKFALSFSYFCGQLDSWILTALSGERLIAVFIPLRAKIIITKSRIKILLLAMFIFLTLFHGESSVRYGLVEIRKGKDLVQNCQPVYFYGLPKKYFVIKDQILVIFLSAFPLLIISFSNVAILIKLAQRRRDQARLGVNTNDNSDTRMNAMLIGVMLAYILLNFPVYVYVVSVNVGQNNFDDVYLRFFIFLVSLGVGLNFYLYFFTSSVFRNDVKNIFKFKCLFGSRVKRGSVTRVTTLRSRSTERDPSFRAQSGDPQRCGSREVQIPLRGMRY